MISSNLTHDIKEQLGNRVSIEPKGADSCMIYMPFIFDDGDPCDFSLARSHDGRWALSDGGRTIRRASYSGTDLLAPGHVQRVQKLAEFYGVTESDGVLSLTVSDDNFADAIYTFTQVSLEVINLAKVPRERHRVGKTDFTKRLARIVESIVPQSAREAGWHHPKFDPDKVYSVDYFVKGKSRQLYLFGIKNSIHAARAAVACYHYKKRGARFLSVAIYDYEERLPVRDTVPLNEIIDKKFPRIREQNAIREFLAKEAAA